MTEVFLSCDQNYVSIENDGETQIVGVGIDEVKVVSIEEQGPPGPPGPEGPAGNANDFVKVVTDDYTMTNADFTVRADSTIKDLNITLPVCATAYNTTTKDGQIFNVNKFVSPHTVNALTQGVDTINGLSSLAILFQANLQVQAGPNNAYTIL